MVWSFLPDATSSHLVLPRSATKSAGVYSPEWFGEGTPFPEGSALEVSGRTSGLEMSARVLAALQAGLCGPVRS